MGRWIRRSTGAAESDPLSRSQTLFGNEEQLFYNKDNLKKWQNGLVTHELISGQEGEPGAKSKIVFKTGKHVIELIETI